MADWDEKSVKRWVNQLAPSSGWQSEREYLWALSMAL